MRNLIVLASLIVCLGQADTLVTADNLAYRLVAEAIGTGTLSSAAYMAALASTVPFFVGLAGLLTGLGLGILDLVEGAEKKAAAKKTAAKAAAEKSAKKAAAKKVAAEWSPILGDADCF